MTRKKENQFPAQRNQEVNDNETPQQIFEDISEHSTPSDKASTSIGQASISPCMQENLSISEQASTSSINEI